ncbi:MAG: adenosylmethionine--8-amino-7-oxononanoate transaminase [Pseudomonadales bacterium]|nr:adenosylmethionine--8-amino-7-oxononanoate transaminase [Pseudomonadales bacterium]
MDQKHIWHPYAAMTQSAPVYLVESAQGVRLRLADGRELIDGMSSWWSVIHGYNHPVMNQAIREQQDKMAHVMFGGLTHEPAIQLAEKLVELTPPALQQVFFSDSGSVAIEVALKMALQYWHATGLPQKNKMLTIRSGYHGDTFAAMSICDPITGMHELFTDVLTPQFFADAPQCRFEEAWDEQDIHSLQQLLQQHHTEIAAVIMEPIVQGAGGMRFYSPHYLTRARVLCDEFDVLLILDEIATNFGRTGKLFACEHAQITPDIMCLGKALTGGYMTLAATLTTTKVSQGIAQGKPGVFMHGPTFMGNPLACSAALASITLLQANLWQDQVAHIEESLTRLLSPAYTFDHVADVRVLGGIGVIETKRPVKMPEITAAFVNQGIWVRPFGKLVYVMPPFVIEDTDLTQLANGLIKVVSDESLLMD